MNIQRGNPPVTGRGEGDDSRPLGTQLLPKVSPSGARTRQPQQVRAMVPVDERYRPDAEK